MYCDVSVDEDGQPLFFIVAHFVTEFLHRRILSRLPQGIHFNLPLLARACSARVAPSWGDPGPYSESR
jgi:hypothetical protein